LNKLLRLLSYLFIVLIVTSCYKGSSGSLIKRKYNKGFFVQHSNKVERKKVVVNAVYYKPSAETEMASTEKVYIAPPIKQSELFESLPVHYSCDSSPEKTHTSASSKSTSTQINKIKVAVQKRSQRKHPSGCFNNGGINDVTGPFAVVVFILLTILYAVAIMSQSPGASWIVAIALGALFAAITMVTGVSMGTFF
jgi:hypothetical protein